MAFVKEKVSESDISKIILSRVFSINAAGSPIVSTRIIDRESGAYLIWLSRIIGREATKWAFHYKGYIFCFIMEPDFEKCVGFNSVYNVTFKNVLSTDPACDSLPSKDSWEYLLPDVMKLLPDAMKEKKKPSRGDISYSVALVFKQGGK